MATALSALDHNVARSQSGMPSYLSGSFVIDDGDNHDFIADARGKTAMTVCVDISTSDQTVTVQVYGAHASTADPGEIGVVAIGGTWTITDAEDIDYETYNDPFPFYVIRVSAASSASGSPTCTLYVNLVP
jgi:hypothetical protein